MSTVRVKIGWSDGRYWWRRAQPDEPFDAEVPESTVRLWEAAARLDAVVADQLRVLDNRAFDARDGTPLCPHCGQPRGSAACQRAHP